MNKMNDELKKKQDSKVFLLLKNVIKKRFNVSIKKKQFS